MDKLEKVINGLECCLTDNPSICEGCPYLETGCLENVRHFKHDILLDALALLKAQVEEIKALRQLVEWAEECGFGLDNILWREYVTEEELDSIDGYVEQMIYVARKAVNGNA